MNTKKLGVPSPLYKLVLFIADVGKTEEGQTIRKNDLELKLKRAISDANSSTKIRFLLSFRHCPTHKNYFLFSAETNLAKIKSKRVVSLIYAISQCKSILFTTKEDYCYIYQGKEKIFPDFPTYDTYSECVNKLESITYDNNQIYEILFPGLDEYDEDFKVHPNPIEDMVQCYEKIEEKKFTYDPSVEGPLFSGFLMASRLVAEELEILPSESV